MIMSRINDCDSSIKAKQ